MFNRWAAAANFLPKYITDDKKMTIFIQQSELRIQNGETFVGGAGIKKSEMRINTNRAFRNYRQQIISHELKYRILYKYPLVRDGEEYAHKIPHTDMHRQQAIPTTPNSVAFVAGGTTASVSPRQQAGANYFNMQNIGKSVVALH